MCEKEDCKIDGEAVEDNPRAMEQLGEEGHLPLVHPTEKQGCKGYGKDMGKAGTGY